MKLSAGPHPSQQEVVTLLQARGAGARPGASRWKRLAFIPVLLIAILGLAIGLTRTDMIGRMAALIWADSEKPAENTRREKGEQGPIAWDVSGKAAEDPSGFESTEGSWVRTVTVEEGDTLRHLALEVYGQVDQSTLDMLMEENPAIDDVNMIIVGQRIAFPPLSDLGNRSDSS